MTRSRLVPRFRATAPWASLAVLLGLSHTLPNRVSVDEDAAARKVAVATAMSEVPFFVGAWIGRDEPVPPEAQKLLRPNAIFSRTYRTPGGIRLHVLLVHCADARDMIGHYPPVCYPSAGWVALEPDGPPHARVSVGEQRLPVRLYRFRRMRDRGREERIRIFNTFVLPGGTVSPEFSDINRLSQRRAVSARGVAQLQVISPEAVPPPEALAAASDLLTGMQDLFAALQLGQEESTP